MNDVICVTHRSSNPRIKAPSFAYFHKGCYERKDGHETRELSAQEVSADTVCSECWQKIRQEEKVV
jgi:hypothetical protein